MRRYISPVLSLLFILVFVAAPMAATIKLSLYCQTGALLRDVTLLIENKVRRPLDLRAIDIVTPLHYNLVNLRIYPQDPNNDNPVISCRSLSFNAWDQQIEVAGLVLREDADANLRQTLADALSPTEQTGGLSIGKISFANCEIKYLSNTPPQSRDRQLTFGDIEGNISPTTFDARKINLTCRKINRLPTQLSMLGTYYGRKRGDATDISITGQDIPLNIILSYFNDLKLAGVVLSRGNLNLNKLDAKIMPGTRLEANYTLQLTDFDGEFNDHHLISPSISTSGEASLSMKKSNLMLRLSSKADYSKLDWRKTGKPETPMLDGMSGTAKIAGEFDGTWHPRNWTCQASGAVRNLAVSPLPELRALKNWTVNLTQTGPTLIHGELNGVFDNEWQTSFSGEGDLNVLFSGDFYPGVFFPHDSRGPSGKFNLSLSKIPLNTIRNLAPQTTLLPSRLEGMAEIKIKAGVFSADRCVLPLSCEVMPQPLKFDGRECFLPPFSLATNLFVSPDQLKAENIRTQANNGEFSLALDSAVTSLTSKTIAWTGLQPESFIALDFLWNTLNNSGNAPITGASNFSPEGKLLIACAGGQHDPKTGHTTFSGELKTGAEGNLKVVEMNKVLPFKIKMSLTAAPDGSWSISAPEPLRLGGQNLKPLKCVYRVPERQVAELSFAEGSFIEMRELQFLLEKAGYSLFDAKDFSFGGELRLHGEITNLRLDGSAPDKARLTVSAPEMLLDSSKLKNPVKGAFAAELALEKNLLSIKSLSIDDSLDVLHLKLNNFTYDMKKRVVLSGELEKFSADLERALSATVLLLPSRLGNKFRGKRLSGHASFTGKINNVDFNKQTVGFLEINDLALENISAAHDNWGPGNKGNLGPYNLGFSCDRLRTLRKGERSAIRLEDIDFSDLRKGIVNRGAFNLSLMNFEKCRFQWGEEKSEISAEEIRLNMQLSRETAKTGWLWNDDPVHFAFSCNPVNVRLDSHRFRQTVLSGNDVLFTLAFSGDESLDRVTVNKCRLFIPSVPGYMWDTPGVISLDVTKGEFSGLRGDDPRAKLSCSFVNYLPETTDLSYLLGALKRADITDGNISGEYTFDDRLKTKVERPLHGRITYHSLNFILMGGDLKLLGGASTEVNESAIIPWPLQKLIQNIYPDKVEVKK